MSQWNFKHIFRDFSSKELASSLSEAIVIRTFKIHSIKYLDTLHFLFKPHEIPCLNVIDTHSIASKSIKFKLNRAVLDILTTIEAYDYSFISSLAKQKTRLLQYLKMIMKNEMISTGFLVLLEKLWFSLKFIFDMPVLFQSKNKLLFRLGKNIFSFVKAKEKLGNGIIINDVKSCSLSILKNLRSELQNKRLIATYSLKYLLEPKLECIPKNLNLSSSEFETLSERKTKTLMTPRINHGNDVIVQVSIHQSDNPSSRVQEFLFLGSQTLVELKDRIICPNLMINCFKSGSQYPTYIFYGGSFFSDTNNIKLDIEIQKTIRFLFKKQEFFQQSMGTTRFDDLVLRFGIETRGLLWHLDGCCHTLYISNLWLLNPKNCIFSRAKYPISLNVLRSQKMLCDVCMVKQAKRITFYDKEALFNKMIFCEDCYRRLHYDKNGKTLYKDYLVFPLCNQ